MIYTVGRRDIYEPLFLKAEPPRKRGRDADFVGGSVWRFREEAERYCAPGYSVYGVLADWETQTSPNEDGPWNDLLVDALLVRLGPEGSFSSMTIIAASST